MPSNDSASDARFVTNSSENLSVPRLTLRFQASLDCFKRPFINFRAFWRGVAGSTGTGTTSSGPLLLSLAAGFLPPWPPPFPFPEGSKGFGNNFYQVLNQHLILKFILFDICSAAWH